MKESRYLSLSERLMITLCSEDTLSEFFELIMRCRKA
jgi:hypothetical protein